jgi:hypothetical protein
VASTDKAAGMVTVVTYLTHADLGKYGRRFGDLSVSRQ